MDDEVIMETLERAIEEFPRTNNAMASLTEEHRVLLRDTRVEAMEEIREEGERIDLVRAEAVAHVLDVAEFAKTLAGGDERSPAITWSMKCL